jgi:hypothetical protein
MDLPESDYGQTDEESSGDDFQSDLLAGNSLR